VQGAYERISEQVAGAVAVRGSSCPVSLVVVSKTKPLSLLKAAYDVGARNFGENYIQEVRHCHAVR
jgi:hypothetical protein